MKNIIIGFGSIMVTVLTIMTIAALNINSTNKLDLESATRLAVYQTLDQTLPNEALSDEPAMVRVKNDDGTYKKDENGKYVFEPFYVESDDDLKTLFYENLSMLLKGQKKVSVKILTADYVNGILSVNVAYEYTNMGFDRTIDVTQTVIRDGAGDTTIKDPDPIPDPDPTPPTPDPDPNPEPEPTGQSYVYATVYSDGELVLSANEITAEKDVVDGWDSKKCDLTGDLPDWNSKASDIKTVNILGTIRPTSCFGWFYSFFNVTSINNLSNLDTSYCANMSYMFSNCSVLKNIDVSNFNTSNVTSMREMFSGCLELTSIDVSGFNTSKVTEIHSMFTDCRKIGSINISGFDLSNVTDMNNMFARCYWLTSLNIKNIDTSHVTNMSSMFESCKSLASLNVTNLDTSQVTNMTKMFSNCSNLTTLDLSKFNTEQVTSMNQMFLYCSNLTNLDLSNFKTPKLTNMSQMFSLCSNLTTLDISGFDTSQSEMSYLFNYCSKLVTIYVGSGWTIDHLSAFDQKYMFNRCGTDHVTQK